MISIAIDDVIEPEIPPHKRKQVETGLEELFGANDGTKVKKKKSSHSSNPKYSKAKGRKLQNLLRDKLRVAFPSLEDDDVKSQTMGMPGEDIVLSPAARRKIPLALNARMWRD